VCSSDLTDKLIEHGNGDFDFVPLVDRRCKATNEEIKAALDGKLTFAQAEKLKLIRRHFDHMNSLKAELESLIIRLAEKFQPQIDLLLTVPGIGEPLTAIRILAEIGADMSVFETAKQLCSWAGLSPQNNESAGKKKTTRIARAGAYLKPLLVQCALAVSASGKHPELRDKFNAIKKRRGGKKAIIAIARKLLTAIWHMLSKNEAYNAELYRMADKPPVNHIITAKQAVAIMRNKGFLILDEETGEVA
jgi:transposase